MCRPPKPMHRATKPQSTPQATQIELQSLVHQEAIINRKIFIWIQVLTIKTGTELIEGLCYKLRMMGVAINGPCHVKADNLSDVRNISQPESTLKKETSLIAFQYVRDRDSTNHQCSRCTY